MEPVGSLTHLQELSTCPYPEPHHSSLHHPILISSRSILILSTSLRLGLPSGLFPSRFPTNNLYAFLFPRSCYMPRPSHPPRLDHSNYTWRRVQITKLLVVQFSPSSTQMFSSVPCSQKPCHIQGDERWIVCTPLSVNVFITIAPHSNSWNIILKPFLEHPCITSESSIEP
jgi:hypothetical protein